MNELTKTDLRAGLGQPLPLRRPETEIVLEPAALGAMIPEDADLVVDGRAYPVRDGRVRTSLSAGTFMARLVAWGSPVVLDGPISVADGRGSAPLRIVPREATRVRLVTVDNGVVAPYAGPAVVLVPDGERLYPDLRVETDPDGWFVADLRTDRPVEIRPGGFGSPAPSSGWSFADAAAPAEDGAERTVLQRSWTLQVTATNLELAGRILHVRGPVVEAATVNEQGAAFFSVPPGTYAVTRRDVEFTPAEITVGPGLTRVEVTSAPAPPIELPPMGGLRVETEFPPGSPVVGEVLLDGPDGTVASLPAAPTLDFVLLEPGPYRISLVGHPTLDGTADVMVADGDPTTVGLPLEPGPRSTWRVEVEGGDAVTLRTADDERDLGIVGAALPVRPAEPARLLVELPTTRAMAITPIRPTTADTAFAFRFDGTVTVEEEVLVAYADGWCLALGPGVHRARLGDATVYVRRPGGFARSEIDLVDGAIVRVPHDGEPAEASELDAVIDVPLLDRSPATRLDLATAPRLQAFVPSSVR